MLSMVNQSSLSAVSLANQVHFLLTGFYYGVTSGITMLVSQYWGRGDRKSILTIMGISLRLSVGVTALVTLLCFFFPAAIMRIFTNDTELIAIGAEYLRIIGFSYLLMSISQVYLCVMRSMERARVSTIISSIALLLNIFLNAVFIFGFLGAPKLGRHRCILCHCHCPYRRTGLMRGRCCTVSYPSLFFCRSISEKPGFVP